MRQKIKFKQTEIGMIPEDWEVIKLKEALKKKGYIRGPFGSALRRPELKSEGIPVYEQANAIYNHRNFRFFIDEEKYKDLKRFTVEENDLIISCSGTFGKVTIIKKEDQKGIISQALLILRPDTEKVSPNFLKYFFSSNLGYNAIASRSLGSVQINIGKREVIEEIQLAIPQDRNEQDFIIKILSSLDSKIELNHKTKENLEAIGLALFNKWFNIDDIPDNWQTKPLDEIAEYLNGLPLQKYPAGDDEEYLPVIKIRELRNGISEQTDKASLDVPEEYVVKNGDVLFSWSGTLEVEIWTNGKGALNQHLFKVSSKDYPKWFYYYWTKHFLRKFRHIAKGKATTMGHIQRHNLTESGVIIPDKKAFEDMNKIMFPIVERLITINLESQNLERIRDMLLPKLMSGKIRVPVEVRT